MKIGVIGVGRIGALHIRNLAQDPRVSDLLITDIDIDAATSVADEVYATVRNDQQSLWKSNLDAIVICSPTPTHPELIHRGAREGIPIFCEKPIALDPRAALPLIRDALDLDPRVHIGFPRRFEPAFRRARDTFRSGALGALNLVQVITLDPEPPPPHYVEVSGGMFRDQSIHDFDTLRWLVGTEVQSVTAVGTNKIVPHIAELDDIDSATTVLQFESGVLATVCNSRANGAGYDIRLELHGTESAVSAGLADFTPLVSMEQDATFPSGPAARFFTDRFAVAYRDELRAFVSFARGEQESPCTINDAFQASWIAEAADESRRLGRTVQMSEIDAELPA